MNPQERANRLRIFREELADLERQRVLELAPEQRARLDEHVDRTLRDLASRHDVDITGAQQRISWGMRIASALGGLALCAAVVLFFVREMGSWPTWLLVTLLIATPVVLTLAAEFAARRETTRYYTLLISLAAFAAFVADLSLLGSIFNLAPTPNALAMWGLYALALAYHFGLKLVLAAGLTSLLGWIALAPASWRGFWWLGFDRPEDLLLGGVVVLAASAILQHGRRGDFPAVYRLVGMLGVFLAMLFLSFEGSVSYMPWGATAVARFYQYFSLAAAVGAVWIGIRRNWTGAVNTGAAFFVIYLHVRMFDWWFDKLPMYLFFLLIGLVAMVLVAVFKRLRAQIRSAV